MSGVTSALPKPTRKSPVGASPANPSAVSTANIVAMPIRASMTTSSIKGSANFRPSLLQTIPQRRLNEKTNADAPALLPSGRQQHGADKEVNQGDEGCRRHRQPRRGFPKRPNDESGERQIADDELPRAAV